MSKNFTIGKTIIAAVASLWLCSCANQEVKSEKSVTYPLLTITASDKVMDTNYPATIKGWQTVEIRPQISGTITDIQINEGARVRNGQILFIIHQTPYQAEYDIAEANVRSAEANLATAELVLNSNRELLKNQVVSDFDMRTAENDVAEAKAKLALASAQMMNASNNLSYTEVRSPVNGVAGMIPYKVGALVNNAIAEPLVTVSDIDKVYAYFSMTESQLLDLIGRYGNLENALKNMPEVHLLMSNGNPYSRAGKIDAISGIISENTGSVRLRAVFPNPEHLLREGGSGTVLIPVSVTDAIVIPAASTYEIQDKINVFKVVDGKTTSQRIEVLPISDGKEYIVKSGLEIGEVIVAEGAGLLREGMTVKLDTEKED